MKYFKGKYIITLAIVFIIVLMLITINKIINNRTDEIIEVQYVEETQLEHSILFSSKDPMFMGKESMEYEAEESIEYESEVAITYNGLEHSDNGKPYCIKINRQENVVTIYVLDEEGKYTIPVKAMVCSVGLNNSTPTGTYHTYNRREWAMLYGNVWGQYAYRIDGSIMFHSVPYYTKHKDSLKSEEFNKLGKAASQGCIRLSILDVKWIYDNCPYGTIVEIFDSDYLGPLGKPTIEKIDLNSENIGWDPTDTDKDNPWLKDNLPIIYGTKDIVIERTGELPDLLSGVMGIGKDYTDCTEDIILESNVNTSKLGEYTVNYSLISGDMGICKKAKVTVVDNIPPKISDIPESKIITIEDAASENIQDILLEGVIAEDSGEVMVQGSIFVSYNDIAGKPAGEYLVKYIAIDEAGNKSLIKDVIVKIIN